MHPRAELIDIRDVELCAKLIGSHFFDKQTMRFFKSKTSKTATKLDNVAYFVTSEQNGTEPRRYTIRYCAMHYTMEDCGQVLTLGEFQQYPTSKAAWKAIDAYLEGK